MNLLKSTGAAILVAGLTLLATQASALTIGGAPSLSNSSTASTAAWTITVDSFVFDNVSSLPSDFPAVALGPGDIAYAYVLSNAPDSTGAIDSFSVSYADAAVGATIRSLGAYESSLMLPLPGGQIAPESAINKIADRRVENLFGSSELLQPGETSQVMYYIATLPPMTTDAILTGAGMTDTVGTLGPDPAVPEPSAALLLLAGMGLLAGRSSRKRS